MVGRRVARPNHRALTNARPVLYIALPTDAPRTRYRETGMWEVDGVAEGGGAGDGGRGREVAAVDAAASANKSVDELIDVASVCSRRRACWGLTQAYSQLKVMMRE